MPYVKKAKRKVLDRGGVIEEPGDLAYVETSWALGALPADFRFKDLADVGGKWLRRALTPGYTDAEAGATFFALLEFYRRLVADYENRAIAKNGDIPGYGGGK
jgi:hypothetical protein